MRAIWTTVSAVCLAITLPAVASAAQSSLTPPVLPLVVRNPYLSTWLGHARENPWDFWPMFYTGKEIGLSVMAQVPSSKTVYPLLGKPQDSITDGSGDDYTVAFPHYAGSSFDSSVTNLTYHLEVEGQDAPITITLSFLSPLTPTSTIRQSIPASYLAVHVDGGLDLSVYIDANGQWVTGNTDNAVKWELVNIDGQGDGEQPLKAWQMERVEQQLFTQFDDRGEWGQFFMVGPDPVQHQAGDAATLRQQFAKTGALTGDVDTDYRAVLDREPVVAFSYPFTLQGDSGNTTNSVVFSLGLVQDPVVQFASASGIVPVAPLWMGYLNDSAALFRFHHDDFATASALAQNYSTQLAEDALQSGNKDYQDIVALSARQVLGGTMFGGTRESPLLFLKEISSDGNSQTVDVIFPSFPFFVYTNPRWLAYLLEPLLEHQLSGQYPNKYSMHDLGGSFPNITGHPDGKDEYMPLEECGNMMIMGLALANALRWQSEPDFMNEPLPDTPELSTTTPPAPKHLGNDTGVLRLSVDAHGFDQEPDKPDAAAKSWLQRSYVLWKQWAVYLVDEALVPANQLCTDDFAGALANQTNLALKGIIGIRAMSEISLLVDQGGDADHYLGIAQDYLPKWQQYGTSPNETHAKLAYTLDGSWTTLYNLYADAMLCFHLDDESGQTETETDTDTDTDTDTCAAENADGQAPIPRAASSPFIPNSVYSGQSTWYSSVLNKYGLPLDNRHVYAKSDWEFFAAAVASSDTRMAILGSVALWVNETVTDKPLTDLYKTDGDGGFPDPYFFARPVVGGHFSFLALERACEGKAVAGLHFLDS